MDEKFSIKLDRYGERGWRFSVTGLNYLNKHATWIYRTNMNGEGLWVVGKHNDKQILGTCQFSLPQSRKSAYAKIRYQVLNHKLFS